MKLPAQTLACYSLRPPLPIWWMRWWKNCPQQSVWPFQNLTRGKNDTALHAKSENCQAAAADGGLSGAVANKPVSLRQGWRGGWGSRCCLSTCCFAFTWYSSRRKTLLAHYGLWHDQSVIRWLKLVVTTEYQHHHRALLLPLQYYAFTWRSRVSSMMARVNTGGRCCRVSLLVNISINVSVRTPHVKQECVLASRK